jgi:hypothetical protein
MQQNLFTEKTQSNKNHQAGLEGAKLKNILNAYGNHVLELERKPPRSDLIHSTLQVFLKTLKDDGEDDLKTQIHSIVPRLRNILQRHSEYVFDPSSNIRKIKSWETMSAIDQALATPVAKTPSPASIDGFYILHGIYKPKVLERMKTMGEILTRSEANYKNPGYSQQERESLFQREIEEQLRYCSLLGGLYYLNSNKAVKEINAREGRKFEELCKPFLCKDGSGLPLFQGKDEASFRTHQCRLIYDYENIKNQFFSRFKYGELNREGNKWVTAPGRLCPSTHEPSVPQGNSNLKKQRGILNNLFNNGH